jgi:hypothetical protein
MERITRPNKPRQISRRLPTGKRISAKNAAAIKLLDKWMSTPDDMGEEWWAEFEAELNANRFTLRCEESEGDDISA